MIVIFESRGARYLKLAKARFFLGPRSYLSYIYICMYAYTNIYLSALLASQEHP